MSQSKGVVRVGVGIILVNEKGQILVGKRKGGHAPYWSIPGGHLELGESFEQAAVREMQEETGLDIEDPRVIAVSNNLHTYQDEGVHTVSVCLTARHCGASPRLTEPDKCEQWRWVAPDNLPQPHFEASRLSIECYLNKEPYRGTSA